MYLRGMDGLYALSLGMGKYQFVRAQYSVSGAGMDMRNPTIHYKFVRPGQAH
jgi:hypothetical protein